MLHVRIDVPPIPEAIEAVAEGLVQLNVVLMAIAAERGLILPPLYGSGVRYRREPKGREWWESSQDILGIAANRTGDCEDLAAYRAAELRLEGENARVVIITNSRGNFHAVVEREDGTLEDPSRELYWEEQDERAARRKRKS